MTHLWTGAADSLVARCGRVVKPSQLTKNPREAQCLACRRAFERVLEALPDVFVARKPTVTPNDG